MEPSLCIKKSGHKVCSFTPEIDKDLTLSVIKGFINFMSAIFYEHEVMIFIYIELI